MEIGAGTRLDQGIWEHWNDELRFTNRMALATGMIPNEEYDALFR